MTEYAHLWLFFLMVFGVVLLPGLDMAYVLGSALSGGRARGLVAVAGMVAGGTVHVAAGAMGLGALFTLLPGAYEAVLLAGALYIAWVGLSALRSTARFGVAGGAARAGWPTFRGAMATNLLNPKAYMFMLAIFPQFMRPEYGTLATQAVALGLIIAVTQAGVYGLVALGAGALRAWLARKPGAGAATNRGVGALLIAAAIATAIDGLTSP